MASSSPVPDSDFISSVSAIRGSTLKVEIGRNGADFTLLEGKPAVFYVNGKACSIKEEGGTWHEEI